MKDCSPLLYFDKQNHIWRFYVKDNGELVYSIMYEEDKWTKENKIDSGVLDFTVNIDKELKVYIVYSIRSGELKYCIWENNQWFGKTIYSFDNECYEISELNVSTIGKCMHIFFIAKDSNKKGQCSLMHLCLNNEKNLVNTIYNISFIQDAYSHYQIDLLKSGSIYLLLIHKQENEIAIKFTEYKDHKWSIPKRLYGINGNNINFCTMEHNNKISILNLSKENSIYSLEHVLIESDGKMKSNKIYEGSIEVKYYLLFKISGVLYTMWSEGEKIFTSSYKDKWSEHVLYGDKIDEAIVAYKYLSLNSKYKELKSKYVLGTIPPEIKILLPEYKNNEYKNYSLENSEKEIVTSVGYRSEKTLTIDNELIILKRSNKNLEKKVLELQLQLQQKKKIIEETDESFIKLSNGKKKAEEKLKIITEVQQVSMKELAEIRKQEIARETVDSELKKELEEIKKQKIAKENSYSELKNKTKELISGIEQFKKELEESRKQKIAKENSYDELKKELEAAKKQRISKENMVGELKNKLKELTSENEQLKIELKYENNKGIMDRILKKKLDK